MLVGMVTERFGLLGHQQLLGFFHCKMFDTTCSSSHPLCPPLSQVVSWLRGQATLKLHHTLVFNSDVSLCLKESTTLLLLDVFCHASHCATMSIPLELNCAA
jgi:hypothetical protein